MSDTTQHGENIASQIQGYDAYGQEDIMTLADIWLIIDNIHTHFMDTDRNPDFLEGWLRQLEDMDMDLPPI